MGGRRYDVVEETELGKIVQQYRINRGLTLQELAEKTGYTKGYLSKIENSEKAPPVSTIINLAKALNVSISEIFGETDESSLICLVKKAERRVLARDGTVFGYAYQTLAHRFHNKKMEPYFLTIPLAPKENVIFQHKGEELVFVLEGSFKFFYGEKEFIVEEGDCMYFDSSIPHYPVCQGDKEAKCLIVIYTPD
jgi:transcriptional regulator with XRE-family HTH domain